VRYKNNLNKQPNVPVEKYRRLTFNLGRNKIKKFRKNVRVSLDFGEKKVVSNGKSKVSALKKVKSG